MITNTKGRYGFLVSIITTLCDFVLLNAVYFYVLHGNKMVGQFNEDVVWIFLNISYVPAILLFSDVHNKRILFVDRIMVMLFQVLIVHVLVMMSLVTLAGYDDIPIRIYVVFYAIFYALLLCWWIISRKIVKFFRQRGLNFRRIIIAGWNGSSKRLYQEIESDSGYGYRIIGIFDDAKHKDIKINGKLSDIEGFIKENNVDELYCALPSEEDNVGNLAKIADNYDVAFYYVPMISGFMTTTFDLTSFGNIPVLVYRSNPLRHLHNRLLKRFFDIVVSLVAIGVAACTILIPVVIAIKVSSKGPVLFKQKRTGYKGREFTCLKFRTMKVNQEADTMQATKDDPRKTRVGDFLRRTSIDEIPQFLNVLAGSMSVVGPRPHMVKQTDEYKKLIDRYMVRHMIKPGITGLAQVHGYRGQTKELWQMEKRVEYDVMYIETWSLWLDIKIIIRTIINAVKGEKNAF